jgi:ferrous iron transport protein B
MPSKATTEDNLDPLREKLCRRRRAGRPPFYTPLVCISLLVFYVFAMQCISTIAIVKRETGSWRWPLIQLAYMTSFVLFGSIIRDMPK